MPLPQSDVAQEPEGQATFDMANLRPKTTNLPFVVWVSQKDNYQHDVRVEVAPSAKVVASQMGTYALRPFRSVGGERLNSSDEKLLDGWVNKNFDVLLALWNADIECTEDMIARIVPA